MWQSKCFSTAVMKTKYEHGTASPLLQASTPERPIPGCSPKRLRSRYSSKLRITFGLILFLISTAPAWAQNALPDSTPAPSADLSSRKYLLGDWGGARSTLAEEGVTFDLFYITDLQANPSGGLQQTQAGWERFRGTIDINFDRMISWQGLNFHATGLWQSGANLGGKIGTLANPSDLVSRHTTRLDSFWVQQVFLNNRIRLRAGQLAGLDFYGNQEYGGTWLIEPLGYAYGNLFSSIFESFNPAGVPGAEILYAPATHFYLKSSVMSGNRNPYQQDPTGTNFAIRNSANFLFEAGYLWGVNRCWPAEVGPPPPDCGAAPVAATGKRYPGAVKF